MTYMRLSQENLDLMDRIIALLDKMGQDTKEHHKARNKYAAALEREIKEGDSTLLPPIGFIIKSEGINL